MKKCIQCGSILDDDYNIKLNHTSVMAYMSIKKEETYKVKAAVCPKCGYVEFYADMK